MANESECFTCAVVNSYVDLAGKFTSDLSNSIVEPMWILFGSLASLWIVVHGIKIILGSLDVREFGREFIYMIIAAGMLSGQGPELVNSLYSASLSTISGAASAVLSTGTIADETGVTGGQPDTLASNGVTNLDGMTSLVMTAEQGIFKVFEMVGLMIANAPGWGPSIGAYVTGFLILLPYAILLIVYFAQVVVTIFRVMMIAALSPILMLMFGFNFGRGMVFSGLRTMFASFMVLFGATIALAVCLYGVSSMDIAGEPIEEEVAGFLNWSNPRLWVTIMLGWLGTAFMAEATSIANSISEAKLTNQAAAIITAGATATGLTLLNHGKGRAGQIWQKGKSLIDQGRGSGSNAGTGSSESNAQGSDRFNEPGIDNSHNSSGS
tara:strand:- start:11619 stop:12761 length:1143 start_codon:yes stop_codon:yes gene_type:complete